MTSAAPPSRLAELVDEILAGVLDRDAVEATYLGDHTRDTELPDPSEDAARTRAAQLRAQLGELAAVTSPDQDEQVDAAVLHTVLAAELFQLDEVDEASWNPMLHNPGGGVHALLSRDFAPLPDRLTAVTGRLAAVPAYLAAARGRLATMSRVHLDTALTQLRGTIAVLDTELPARAGEAPARLADAVDIARAALVEHCDWLAQHTDAAVRDPRLGEEAFAAKLALTLDTAFDPASLLARAETDLDRLTAEIAEQAARISPGPADARTVRAVLGELAADAPTDATILGLCRDAYRECTDFVRQADLVTIYDDPVHVVEMPELDRGVAAAYCRPSGPLETAALPTEFAVSPTPADWSAEQIASFYREYNAHMLHNLTVHEAMPGHALQLMHANRYRGATPVRAVWWSGPLVEGWAVYTEELMVERGYRADVSPRAAAALRMQQLKMKLRGILNTILDVRFHCGDLDEAQALALMSDRGFQEDGEAVGKWRRVQLSSTQLCTYYAGYLEVRGLVDDLRTARPGWSDRQVHDAVLAHGAPPVRHLRRLVLGAAGG